MKSNIEAFNLEKNILKILLKDRTTNANIVWATDDYKEYGLKYSAGSNIKIDQIIEDNVIQPRVSKNQQSKDNRTRNKAEVFTPSWICNEQNNLIDDNWFERENVFNITYGKTWKATKEKIKFPKAKNKKWKDYIDAKRMEVACGEAPYLASRYDTVKGNIIEVEERIGLLDRKLRVINERVNDEKQWMRWVARAYKSIYGFEYQGDNLFLARINLLYTFMDNIEYKFGRKATNKELKKIAKIISWNIWQMDEITNTIPYCDKKIFYQQLSLFEIEDTMEKLRYCKIKDWSLTSNNIIEYRGLIGGNN